MPNETQWTQDNLSQPHAVGDKAHRVRAMFDAIAPSYDLNNRVHSMWQDQAWRRAALRAADLREGDVVLDVACGTGDLTIAFANARPRPANVIGLDFTPRMLTFATSKSEASSPRSTEVTGAPAPTTYLAGDAMALPLDDASVDVVSIAFGIRNVSEPAGAIAEFARVLRPGGRLVILEFSLPTLAPLRWGYLLYFNHVLPRTATWISGDRSGAYRYLPRSVNTFLGRGQMVQMMQDAGFTSTTQRPLTFGIAMIYRGEKPA